MQEEWTIMTHSINHKTSTRCLVRTCRYTCDHKFNWELLVHNVSVKTKEPAKQKKPTHTRNSGMHKQLYVHRILHNTHTSTCTCTHTHTHTHTQTQTHHRAVLIESHLCKCSLGEQYQPSYQSWPEARRDVTHRVAPLDLGCVCMHVRMLYVCMYVVRCVHACI